MFNIGGELSELPVVFIHLAFSPTQNAVSRAKTVTFEPFYMKSFHACAYVRCASARRYFI